VNGKASERRSRLCPAQAALRRFHQKFGHGTTAAIEGRRSPRNRLRARGAQEGAAAMEDAHAILRSRKARFDKGDDLIRSLDG
jgi:hypothetical protein